MGKNMIDEIIFAGLVSISIIILISQLTQAAAIEYLRNKPQSSASDVSLQSVVTELERQSQLTNGQFVFDFPNSTADTSNETGGRTIAPIVR